MLMIRLQRIGKKNRPSYRVVVSEKKRDLYGKHNEILGNYDPVANPKQINLKADRIKHWISVGAQPSATVHNLLVSEKIIESKKTQAWRPKVKKEKPDQGGPASGRKEKEDGDKLKAKTDEPADAEEEKKSDKKSESKEEEPKKDKSKEEPKKEEKSA
jgi:small subunit ribosomal protein S16